MQSRILSRAARCLTVGVLALLLATPAANAATFAGGTTQLTFSKSFKKTLKLAGIKIRAAAPAKVAAGRISLPIASGQATLARKSSGSLQHDGGVTLKAGRRSMVMSKFVEVLAGAKATLKAQVRGRSLTLLTQSSSATRPAPDFTKLSGSRLKAALTSKSAAALNKTFKVKVFKRGLPVGTVSFSANRKIVFAPGAGNSNFKFDPATAGAFQGCGMTVEPISPATALPPGPGAPAGTFVFPINSGSMDASTLTGTMAHIGGVKISKPASPSVALTDFAFEYSAAGSPIFTTAADVLMGNRATIGDVTGPRPAASLTATGGTVTFRNTEVRWSGSAVALLSGFFKCTTIPQGSLIGLVDATATVK